MLWGLVVTLCVWGCVQGASNTNTPLVGRVGNQDTPRDFIPTGGEQYNEKLVDQIMDKFQAEIEDEQTENSRSLLSRMPRKSSNDDPSVQQVSYDAPTHPLIYDKTCRCAIPFIYRGVSYRKCLWHKTSWWWGGYWWCSCETNYDRKPKWTHCHSRQLENWQYIPNQG